MFARARSFATLGVLLAIAGLSAGQQALTQQEAASMDQKLAAIAKIGESAKGAKAAAAATPLRTTFTEREVNAYLKFNAKDLPKGLVDPQITIAGDRRVSGRALVDLDAVRNEKERGWLDPAAYLTGSLEVKAAGLFQTSAGKGTFQLESATVGGVPIPKTLLQELVSHYSRTPELPAGIDLDKPFELPASIREVEIQRGAATIVQ